MKSVTFIFLALLAITVLLVLTPLVMILYASFTNIQPGLVGAVTTENYVRIFQQGSLISDVEETFLISIGAVVFSLAIGLPLAWLVAQTDIPHTKFLEGAIFSTIVVPPFYVGISWIFLFANGGLLPTFTKFLFDRSIALDVFSLTAVILAEGLSGAAVIFLFSLVTLKSIDSSLLEAAIICGANQSTIARKIVIPLLQPTILLGVILVFVRTAEDFGTPALLGSGKIFTLATAMYFSLSSQSFTGIPRYGASAAIGIFLLLIIILPLVLGRRIVYRGGRSFYLVSGKGSKIRRKNLRAFRYVAFLVALIYVLFSSVLVFGATLIRSFYVFVGGPVTLSNYYALIDVPLITRSIVNSIILAVAGAGLTMLFGLGLSYVSHRTNVRGRSLLDILGAVPTIIPGLVLGLGALWFWSFTPLLSSLIAVIVTVMIRFLPYSLNTLAASFDSIDISLDEAGRVIGASLPTTFRKITAPLMRNGFIYGYSILYGYFMIELATPLFLAGATTEVMPVVAYIYTIDGFYGEASAIVMLNMLMILPVILFLWHQRKSALLATPISV